MRSKNAVPEKRIIVLVCAIALAIFGFYAWGFTKDGVPGWSLWVVGGMIAFFTLLTLQSLLPSEEETLYQRLAEAGTGVPAWGMISTMRRQGSLETSSHRYIYVRLNVDIELAGSSRPLTIETKVEEALLPGFATGKRIHVLINPNDSNKAAIDRQKNPISIE